MAGLLRRFQPLRGPPGNVPGRSPAGPPPLRAASRRGVSPSLVVVLVLVLRIFTDRSQVVLKHPLGHAAALLAPDDVGGAEVDALKDAGLDDVVGPPGEVRIGADRRN